MNTNYSRWEQYNVEKALLACDEAAKSEEHGIVFKKLLEEQKQEASEVQAKLQETADALKSKLRVDALKAKGKLSRSTRNRGAGKSESTDVKDNIVETIAPSDITNSTNNPNSTLKANDDGDVSAKVALLVSDFSKAGALLETLWSSTSQLTTIIDKPNVGKKDRLLLHNNAVRAIKQMNELQRLQHHLRLSVQKVAAEELGGCSITDLFSGWAVSLAAVRTQLLSITALNALHLRRFASAAELARVLLVASIESTPIVGQGSSSNLAQNADCRKVPLAPKVLAALWLMRSIAFAGMGNPYLTSLHLRRAYHICPDFDGLSGATELMENLEDLVAEACDGLSVRISAESHFYFEVLSSLRRAGFEIRTDGEASLRSPRSDADANQTPYRFDGPLGIHTGISAQCFEDLMTMSCWQLQYNGVDSAESLDGIDAIEDDDVSQHTSGSSKWRQLLTAWYTKQMAETIQAESSDRLNLSYRGLLVECKELFSQAQVLRQESMLTSARCKYLAASYLGSVLMHLISTSIEVYSDQIEYLNYVVIAGLANASFCSAQCTSSRGSSDIAVGLEDLGLTVHVASSSSVGHVTKCKKAIFVNFSAGKLQELSHIQLIQLALLCLRVSDHTKDQRSFDHITAVDGSSGDINNLSLGVYTVALQLRLCRSLEIANRYNDAIEVANVVGQSLIKIKAYLDEIILQMPAANISSPALPTAEICGFSSGRDPQSLLLFNSIIDGPITLQKIVAIDVGEEEQNQLPAMARDAEDSVRSIFHLGNSTAAFYSFCVDAQVVLQQLVSRLQYGKHRYG